VANPEHAYWFREGSESWNRWRATNKDIIPDLNLVDGRGLMLDSADLSGALLRGADLSGASLQNANLQGAKMDHMKLLRGDLSHANLSVGNLDHAVLCGTNLTSAIFVEGSFVGAELCNAQLSNAIGSRAIFTGAKFNDALLVETILESALLDHVDFQGALIRRADLSNAKLTDSDFNGTELDGSRINSADLTDANCCKASIKDCNLKSSTLRRTRLSEASLTRSDLSDAILDQIDFDGVDLNGVVLFGTKIINPSWSFKPPIATLFGSLKIRDPIPTHPIQDVLGLPHVLRRAIADAQYLVEVERRMQVNNWQRLLFRLWGITSAFGQSFTRWLGWSLLVLVVFAGVFTQLDFASPRYKDKSGTVQGSDLSSGEVAKETRVVEAAVVVSKLTALKALYVSTVVFTTLGFSDMTPVSTAGRLVVALEVTIGYVMLGALLAILANKLARLS
jgi:uncharacterized protein YjbI with pentapeptide repeats